MRFRKQIILVGFILCCMLGAYAQQKGSIKGVVRDARTKEGLPAVNVKIVGTYYGASTDFDGKFQIQNINSGSYTVQFSIIGYTSVQRTDVTLAEGQVLEINQDLGETVLTLGQEVTIIGEKPLFNLEETSSRRSVTSEDLKAAAIVDVKDVVSQQVGVVQENNEIHIRGGRSYENAYLIDGISVQDPLAGTGFGLQLSTEAVQEMQVITGGYNAEYGQATSGVVNVSLKEGGERYIGSLGHKRDNIGLGNKPFQSFNTDTYEATLSGPEPLSHFLFPILGVPDIGPISFFGNVYAGFSDGFTLKHANQLVSSTFYGSRFAPKEENNWFGLAKLTWKPSPLFKVTYSYNMSVAISQNSQMLQTNLEYVEPNPGFLYEFQNILDNAMTYTHLNQLHSIGITHTLSTSMFYELKLSHFYTNLRADANGRGFSNGKWDYTEPKDIVTFPIQYYNLGHDTIGVIPGDGLYDSGNGFTWHDHYVSEYTVKFDLTNIFSDRNKFKAGFEFTTQEMQNVDIYEPWVGVLGLNNDIYKVKPSFGAFYAQDNVTFKGMILNVGLRLDYWAPGKYVDDAVADPTVITIPDQIRTDYMSQTFGMFGERWKARLSPRIGISHPITDNQMLFFSYGHFSKRPNPQFVYAKLSPTAAQSSFQKFGNPNLNPETTVSYELGLQNQLSNDDVLKITAYYKDIFDYVSTRQARVTSSRISSGNFVTYVNQDYARSRGIEIEYTKRIGRWFRGVASGSYSTITGKSSTPDQGLLVARGIQDETVKENFVSWDRPWQFNLTTTLNAVKGEPLFGVGEGILDDISLYVHAFYESGKRYTPYLLVGYLPQNGRPDYQADNSNLLGANGADWFWIDVNVEKAFSLADLQFALSFQIKNLLDNKNSTIIDPVTGKAYEFGDAVPTSWNDPRYPALQAPVSAYPYNPARYLAGRNLIVGLSMRF
jgi:outer membrane receptor protein involved in Fe transport